MGIKDLPKPGINFRATAGAGNFKTKLSNATRYGGLKNLRDNREAIVKAISQSTTQRAIKRGGLSRLQQLGVWYKIKASDKTVTKEDKREIKEVLKHLGRGAAAEETKSGTVKPSGESSRLAEEQKIERNLNRAQRARIYDESGTANRGETSKRYAGGSVVKSYGIRGVAENIGVDRERAGKIGFAGNYKNSKSPNNPAPKMPLGGIKPIGGFMNN